MGTRLSHDNSLFILSQRKHLSNGIYAVLAAVSIREGELDVEGQPYVSAMGSDLTGYLQKKLLDRSASSVV